MQNNTNISKGLKMLLIISLFGLVVTSFLVPISKANAAETLLGTCWIHDYSNTDAVYGVNGAVFSFNGTCTPPEGTTRINMNINYDDAGTTRINSSTVHTTSDNSCSIKNYDVDITGKMNVGTSNFVDVTTVNSSCAGTGGDARFSFYGNSTPTPTPTTNISASGYLDRADCSHVGGWASDQNSPNSPVTIKIYKDGPIGSGSFVTSILANQFRADVENHAFGIETPSAFKDTSGHTIYVYAVDNETGTDIQLNQSPKNIEACNTITPTQLPTVNLTANPSSIQSGNSSTLTWSSTNATSCNANTSAYGANINGGSNGNIWNGSKSTSGTFNTGSLSNTTTYNITCTNSAGSANDSVTVYVDTIINPQQMSGTLVPSTYSCLIPEGQSNCNINFTWNTINPVATSAVTSNNGTERTGNSGYASLSIPFGGKTFYLYNNSVLLAQSSVNASCASGYWNGNVCVYNNNNQQLPTVNIYASPANISLGETSTIYWNSNNASYCSANGGTNGWGGNKNTSGTFNTGSLSNTTTYNITCTNSAGSIYGSTTVNVINNIITNQPSVTTNNATNVNASSATLNGFVNGNGVYTSAWFIYGTNTNFGYTTQQNSYGYNTSSYNAYISGLLPNTTYYYRAVAQSSQGLIYGNILSFSTGNNNVVVYNNQPTVVVFSDQTTIPYNGTATIRWITTNATSCTAYGGSTGWAGVKSIGPGSFYTGSLSSSKTFTLTCSNGYGSATDSESITVRSQTVVNPKPTPTSLVLITSSVDRNQPIIPTLDNTRPHPGDEINYTVSYQNIGNSSITRLSLRVDLPYEVDYLSSNPNSPTKSGNALVFSLGTLKANGQGTVSVRVRVRNEIPAGANLNFPAILSYVDPSGFSQSVTANVSAQVWSAPTDINTQPITDINEDNDNSLGANVFGAGFLPVNLFGWLLLIMMILTLMLLAKYLFGPMPLFSRKTITTTVEH